MRIFALLLVGLSIAAYRNQKTDLPLASALVHAPDGQSTNLFFQSTDAGKTWQDLSLSLPVTLKVNTVFTQGETVFLGTETGLYHSTNPETGGWVEEHFGKIVTNDFGRIVLSERVTDIFPGRSGLYACVAGVGFFRKKPGTNDWQPMHEALPEKQVNAVLEKPDGTLFIGCPSGIYTSKDDGKTWNQVFTGSWVNSLVAAGDVIVGSGDQGLLRSTDGGEHWTCVLPDKGAVYEMSALNDRLAAVRVAGPWHVTDAIPLRASSDGGQTWQRLDEGFSEPEPDIYDLAQAGDYLFCTHQAGISRSADGGKTWELVRPYTSADKWMRLKLVVSGKTVFAIQVWEGC